MVLRWTLREHTCAHHARVEGLFDTLDLSSRSGLVTFLRAQGAALDAIARRLRDDAAAPYEMVAGIDALRRRIGDDLRTLDAAPVTRDIAMPSPDVHPMGLIYVVAGSRLGARVLARRLAASPDPAVRAADTYLGTRDDDMWRRFLVLLESEPVASGDTDRILAGADAGFACFEQAFDTAKDYAGDVRAHVLA